MEREEQSTRDRFLQDVAGHQIKIIRDDGLHRHIRFQRPGDSNQWFEIVTWPNRLVFTGDMGTFVFSRLADMFEFFRVGADINPSYWSEKLLACERNTDNGRVYCPDTFRQNVIESLCNYDLTSKERKLVVESLDGVRFEDGGTIAGIDLQELRVFLPNRVGVSRPKRNFEFTDVWEIPSEKYTYCFIWCCHALKWGIAQYDKAKVEAEEQTKTGWRDRWENWFLEKILSRVYLLHAPAILGLVMVAGYLLVVLGAWVGGGAAAASKVLDWGKGL